LENKFRYKTSIPNDEYSLILMIVGTLTIAAYQKMSAGEIAFLMCCMFMFVMSALMARK